MAFGFSKQRYSPIGIDLGSDSIKLLQLVPGVSAGDPPQFVAAGAAIVPEAARTDPAARQAFVADALKQLLRAQPFKSRRAVLSFPAFQTVMQHLEVGRADGENLDEAVGEQLRTRLHIEPTRMLIRHFPVRQHVREGTSVQEVICLAAVRDVIMRYIDLAHACKLDVVGMHAEPTAVLKAFEHALVGQDAHRVACYIDIGGAMTKVIVAHGAKLVFAKSIHAGGDHITRQLASSRGIGFEEAYRLRRSGDEGPQVAAPAPVLAGVATDASGEDTPEHHDTPTGLPALDAQPASRSGERPAPGRAAHPTSDTIDCIVDELRLCLRYHASMFPDSPVERLVFLGGEAKQVRLCQQIAKAVGIAAQLGDPLARIGRVGMTRIPTGVDLSSPQPGWAVPVGLCLSEAAA
jgi:type IV pilus assembly protein PilM